MVPPAEFIPVAEETGLIGRSANGCCGRPAATAATWPDDIKVAVNLSPVQFKNADAARRRSSRRWR